MKKDSTARRKRKVSELEQFAMLKNNFQISADNKELTIERIILGNDLRCEAEITESRNLLQSRLNILQDTLETEVLEHSSDSDRSRSSVSEISQISALQH